MQINAKFAGLFALDFCFFSRFISYHNDNITVNTNAKTIVRMVRIQPPEPGQVYFLYERNLAKSEVFLLLSCSIDTKIVNIARFYKCLFCANFDTFDVWQCENYANKCEKIIQQKAGSGTPHRKRGLNSSQKRLKHMCTSWQVNDGTIIVPLPLAFLDAFSRLLITLMM